MRPTNYSAGSQFKGRVIVPILRFEFRSRTNRNIAVVFSFVTALSFLLILSLFLQLVYAIVISAFVLIINFIVSHYLLEHIDDKTRESKIKLFYYDQIKKYKKIIDEKGNIHYLKGKRKGECYAGKTIL